MATLTRIGVKANGPAIQSLMTTSEPLVEAKLSDCKTFTLFLKHLQIRHDLCFIFTRDGIKLTTEEAKVCQANAFLQRDLFRTYTWHDSLEDEAQEVAFDLDLPSLLEALSLFGGSTASLYLRYLADQPLQLWLEEGGVVVEVHAQVRRAWQPVDFNFVKSTVWAKIICSAELLKEILGDLDASSPEVHIRVRQNPGLLELITQSVVGEARIRIPEDSPLVSHFSATEPDVQMTYQSALLRPAFKAVAVAEKVSFRLNPEGLLCIQYMIKLGDIKSFLEFIVCPTQATDD